MLKKSSLGSPRTYIIFSHSETPGTYYEEISGLESKFKFFCPVCGLYWYTDSYLPMMGDEIPHEIPFICHYGRNGCGFRNLIVFVRPERI
jgi:hypothetical protein